MNHLMKDKVRGYLTRHTIRIISQQTKILGENNKPLCKIWKDFYKSVRFYLEKKIKKIGRKNTKFLNAPKTITKRKEKSIT